METRLCLIRHGETDWNAERRVQGQVDIPLNAKGLFQAEAVARGLADESFAALYSSDLQRALQTAAPAAAFHHLPIRSDPLLRERHFGVLQSLTAEEARVRHPQASLRHAARDSGYDYEDGESLMVFEQRIRECLRALFRRHRGETILVVTHGGVLDIAYRHATRMPLTSRRDFALPNAGLNWLEGDTQGWRVVVWADLSHADQALDEQPG
ncbi:MAG: histidine phosphatase family protein [Rhodocyclaceae bacterium]|nr:MAG: histidine phosphatase family protein [Rhodocyclaceae bacterium]